MVMLAVVMLVMVMVMLVMVMLKMVVMFVMEEMLVCIVAHLFYNAI